MKFVRPAARSHGGQGREPLRHARVFPRVCFPAAVLIFSTCCLFTDRNWGKRRFSQDKSSKPCVFRVRSTFGLNTFFSSFFFPYTVHTITVLIHKPVGKTTSLCYDTGLDRQLLQIRQLQIIWKGLTSLATILTPAAIHNTEMSLWDCIMKEDAAFMHMEHGTQNATNVFLSSEANTLKHTQMAAQRRKSRHNFFQCSFF